jgi:carbohydrate kinase (thermoresistant glucokinase family)
MTSRRSLILVAMGVSGSGKTTIGALLADRLGWVFQEGDDLHPPENVAKMRAGVPLDDADRAPWLARIAAWIDARLAADDCGIVSCSALKRPYRDILAKSRSEVWFLSLKVSPEIAAERLAGRRGHFMPLSLLESQFATLEEPGPGERVVMVDVGSEPPLAAADLVLARLKRAVGPGLAGF